MNLRFFINKIPLILTKRKQLRDRIQSCQKSPYTKKKNQKATTQNVRHQTVRLHNDCGPT